MKACLHPRSTYLLQGLWQGTDNFAGFGEGSEYVRVEDRREALRDSVRFWAEECDTLKAGGSFRTSTRPTLNLLLLRRAHV